MHNIFTHYEPATNHFGQLIADHDIEPVDISPNIRQKALSPQLASQNNPFGDLFGSISSFGLEAPQETARYEEMKDPNWAEKEFLDLFEKTPQNTTRSPKQTGFEMSFQQISTVSPVPSPTDRRFSSLLTSHVSQLTQAYGNQSNQSSLFFSNQQQQPAKPSLTGMDNLKQLSAELNTLCSNVFITSSYSAGVPGLLKTETQQLNGFQVFSTAQREMETREQYLKRLERQVKIERYKAKKRNWKKKVAYTCRKQVAEKRLRIKGRFLSKEDSERLVNLYGQEGGEAPTTNEQQPGFVGTHNNLNINMIPGEEFVKVSNTKRRKLKVVREVLEQISEKDVRVKTSKKSKAK